MIKVDLHIHISNNNKLLVNPERIYLLKQVALNGSLLKASLVTGISYNKAWKMMEAVNIAAAGPVLEKARGGKGGGGAILTEKGKLILKEFEAIEKLVRNFTSKLNTELNF